MKELTVKTSSKIQMIDITREIQELVRQSKLQQGICIVFVPHTTAAVTINENADPAVIHDIIDELSKVIPQQDNYRHVEGNSAAHIKTTIVGCSQAIIIEDGRLQLGTWQSIFFCEFDGPRHRKVWVKIITSE
jgi:secondary thiamine-phosphate synthase enzyme